MAITADLHWGHHRRGDEATRLLISFLHEQPPDILVLGGDLGAGNFFSDCLARFADVLGRKVLIPGNHDIWVPTDSATDSLHRYEAELPLLAEAQGFHYLDRTPLLLPEAGLALVGNINWYDYSWAIESIRKLFPEEEHRLATKRFTRGRHNDANFVRWALDDAGFTNRVVDRLERHLADSLTQVTQAIVFTHHPGFYSLGFPRTGLPQVLDSVLWDAFSGNSRLEAILTRHADKIPFAFSGHTHRARQADFHGIRGYNVGGDYHFKRLLWLDWPAGTVTEHQFGDPFNRDPGLG